MQGIVFNIKDIVQIWKDWVNNEFDGIVVIDGRRGLGKSTLAVKTSKRFKGFRLKKDIAFSRDDVIKLLSTGKRKIILADEMINVTYNRDFYSETQKKLIKGLNMYRDSCNILIACVPNFYDLDKQFRNLCKMRINVVRRGLAVIHTPNQSSYSSDFWDMSVNEKIERGWVTKKHFKPRYNKLTTFRGYIKYGKLPSKTQQLYEKIKFEKRNAVFVVEEKQKEGGKYDKLVERLKEGKITRELLHQYCLMSGMKYSTVISALSQKLKNDGEETLKSLFKKSSGKSSNISKNNFGKIYKSKVI